MGEVNLELAQPGRAIGRDISRGEAVEHELDSFISKRHGQRVAEEGGRLEMEAWRVTELAEEARKREERRAAWHDHFCHLARCLRARAEEYDQRAQALMEATSERKTA
jgi:hypothetical protein